MSAAALPLDACIISKLRPDYANFTLLFFDNCNVVYTPLSENQNSDSLLCGKITNERTTL